jgi:hypothetical protein
MQQRLTLKEMRLLREASGATLQHIASSAGLATQTVQRAFAVGDVTEKTLVKIEVVLKREFAKRQALIAKLNAALAVEQASETTAA